MKPTDEDLPRLFAGDGNIGLVLGEPSRGLVDVDLDCPQAIVLADEFLPGTPAEHGRAGAPRSHRWYVVDPAPETRRYRAPGRAGATLVELRSTGGQTVVEPSIHPSGEVIEWTVPDAVPARVRAEVLAGGVAALAAAAILAMHWPAGSRHDAALALAGGLARAGWSEAAGVRFIAAVARAAGDEEPPDRVRAVRDTWRADAAGARTTGLPTLAKLVGKDVVSRVVEWLDLREPALAPAAPPPQPKPAPSAARNGSPRAPAGLAEALAAVEVAAPEDAAAALRHAVTTLAPRIRAGQLSETMARAALLAAVALPDDAGDVVFDEALAAAPAAPQVPKLSHKTPIRTARAFVDVNHLSTSTTNPVRLLHHYRGTWYRWRDSAYREVEEAAVRGDLWPFLEAGGVNPSSSRVGNALDALRSVAYLPGHVEAPAWLSSSSSSPPDRPAPEDLIPLRNGLLHAATGTLLPATPEFFTLSALPFDFDPVDATPPTAWLDFLEALWPDDGFSTETLQEFFGYLLTPDTSLQKMLLLIGPRRSGKGTIARVLRSLLGAENVAGPTLAALGTPFGLSPLIGRTAAIISDARISGRADQQVIVERLLSISGEDALDIDRKYRPAWTGQLRTRLVLLSNELPKLSDASAALPGRFVILRLTRSFYGEEDPALLGRLLPELPRILHWALAGRRRLYARGYFEAVPSAMELHAELEDLASPIKAFLRECCEVGAERSVIAGVLFELWTTWCREQGRDYAGTVQSFARDLRTAVPDLQVKRPQHGDKRWRVFEGVGARGALA